MSEAELGDEIETALARAAVSAIRPSAYLLHVVEGPETGTVHRVDGSEAGRVLVGTSPACTFHLSDRRVSRRHLALTMEDGRLRVTDLGSTNGTFVDGVAVRDGYLRGDEVLRLGETALRVEPFKTDSIPPPSRLTRLGRTVGASLEMRRLYPLCERLAQSDVTVVIEGETGTGKEVMAESLHQEGPRKERPFVVFDCTAVAPNLVESALFGHEKGAFTGAVNAHRGVFEEADHGTLLIDEIGDLELSLQPKLLRVLERHEVRRVGGMRNIPVDVRVIAATRRNLDHEVQAGRFRDDLFFRLAVTRVELPPLRARKGDVSLLAREFWDRLGGEGSIAEDVLARLEDYSWPGNVRELHNAIARQIALGHLATGQGMLRTEGVSSNLDPIDAVLERDLSFPEARQCLVEEFERRFVRRVLDKHGGNVAAAAEASGIARRYFQLIKARVKQ